jgi:hypothetical protein
MAIPDADIQTNAKGLLNKKFIEKLSDPSLNQETKKYAKPVQSRNKIYVFS